MNNISLLELRIGLRDWFQQIAGELGNSDLLCIFSMWDLLVANIYRSDVLGTKVEMLLFVLFI